MRSGPGDLSPRAMMRSSSLFAAVIGRPVCGSAVRRTRVCGGEHHAVPRSFSSFSSMSSRETEPTA